MTPSLGASFVSLLAASDTSSRHRRLCRYPHSPPTRRPPFLTSEQDFCFRMKMRCETTPTTGKADAANPPPCNRCRQGGRECTFEGARKTKGTKVEE